MKIKSEKWTCQEKDSQSIDESDSNSFSLRPKFLKEYAGQNNLKKQLCVFIEAAQKREEALDHVLLYGPPGLGKTTLAHVIAHEMNVNIKSSSGPIIEKPGELASLLSHLKKGDILFIDEIHRLSPCVEEILYPALEDYQLDIMIGEGPATRSVKLSLPPFTLIAATTRIGMLSNPLRDRFGILLQTNFYSTEELQEVLLRTAQLLKIEISLASSQEIAKRARGTPRIANKLLKRIRDFSSIRNSPKYIDIKHVEEALHVMNIDQGGLDQNDRRFLRTLIEQFNGGPVGIDSLASLLSEEKDTIEDIIEPYLLQKWLIQRTARGRIATPLAYQYFDLPNSLSPSSPDSQSTI